MCHLLALDHVQIEFSTVEPDTLEIRCRTACTAKTGVEMEALVARARPP
jgi:molybdenum cofactor biosynthesis enzyme